MNRQQTTRRESRPPTPPPKQQTRPPSGRSSRQEISRTPSRRYNEQTERFSSNHGLELDSVDLDPNEEGPDKDFIIGLAGFLIKSKKWTLQDNPFWRGILSYSKRRSYTSENIANSLSKTPTISRSFSTSLEPPPPHPNPPAPPTVVIVAHPKVTPIQTKIVSPVQNLLPEKQENVAPRSKNPNLAERFQSLANDVHNFSAEKMASFDAAHKKEVLSMWIIYQKGIIEALADDFFDAYHCNRHIE